MTGFMISSVFEIIAASFIIYGIFNEEKLIRFEQKIAKKFKSRSEKNSSIKYCSTSSAALTAQRETY